MRQLTPLTSQQFANKAWQRYTGYNFAAGANVIPVVVSELAYLLPAMPLGFVRNPAAFQLVAITSLLPGTNWFVAPNGAWIGGYIPATLRGYPFCVAKKQGSSDLILCVDESSGLIVEAGLGEAFYDADGQPSQTVRDLLAFISEIENSLVVTQSLTDKLQAAGLIQPWPLSVNDGGKSIAVEGIHCINELALNETPDDVFLSLRQNGALLLAYAQLLSMNQLGKLQEAENRQTQLRNAAACYAPASAGFRLSDDVLRFD